MIRRIGMLARLHLLVVTVVTGLLLLGPETGEAAGCGPDVDEARWQTAQVEGTPARLRDYLELCPNGRHAGQARARLAHASEPWEPELVTVQGGCFLMGSGKDDSAREKDERQHEVCVKNFEIARFEVTFDEYDRFVAATGREPPYDEGWGRGRQPVINVSWEDAVAYTRWLSRATGRSYRLPTEAEWEFACRSGGKPERYCGADRANPYGCYADNCRGRAHLVGSRPANGLGIHDMSGNVGEWTCSSYDPRYRGSETKCAKPGDKGSRTGRGGSWLDAEEYLRAASRDGGHTKFRAITLGFRLARDADPCLRLAGKPTVGGSC
jgi:formylglycine-generating enzyme required for sulfatase activity